MTIWYAFRVMQSFRHSTRTLWPKMRTRCVGHDQCWSFSFTDESYNYLTTTSCRSRSSNAEEATLTLTSVARFALQEQLTKAVSALYPRTPVRSVPRVQNIQLKDVRYTILFQASLTYGRQRTVSLQSISNQQSDMFFLKAPGHQHA